MSRQNAGGRLERFRAKWNPVRVKKTRQVKNPEPRSDFIGTDMALGSKVAAALLMGTALGAITVMVPAPAQAQTSRSGGASQERTFAIRPQPLPSALTVFGQQTGLQVSVDAAAARGLTSPGATGTMTAAAALNRLLAGTGLSYRFTGASTVVIGTPGAQAGGANVAGAISLDTIDVQGAANPNSTMSLPPAYAGGQVATGGQVGILGNRSVMDTPFSQTNYTDKLNQNQNAQTIGDVLTNDPSVRSIFPNTISDGAVVRGFPVFAGDFSVDGLYGLVNAARTPMASFERVEVLKGPSALLNGVPPSGSVGGTVNLRSKVAGEMPLAELTPQFSSNSQLGGSADFSRRFGDDKAFGVRVNASYLNGDTPVDHQADRFGLITANFDYRGDRFRVNSTLHYQQFRGDRQSLQYNLGPGLTAIPSAPKATSNAQQPWGFKDSASTFGTLRAEYDLTEQVTAFVAGGISYQRSEFFQTIANALLNTSGDFSYLVGYLPQELRSHTGEAGLRGKFETGILSHEATISATLLQQSTFGAFSIGAGSTSNIYDPTFMAEPIHNSMSFPKLAENEFTSVAIADTISLLNKRMQFIVGGRLQTIETKNFNTATGIQTAGYRKQEFTPAVGVIVKPVENLSLYASYIEGLQAGLVSSSPGNFGQIFPPYVTKQKEIGAKYDFGTATVALAAFEITQPQALTDGIITAPDGEQRNRGIELTVFGTIADGVRALGGIMYVDGVQTKLQVASMTEKRPLAHRKSN